MLFMGLPGQEEGHAAADLLFGSAYPAGACTAFLLVWPNQKQSQQPFWAVSFLLLAERIIASIA